MTISLTPQEFFHSSLEHHLKYLKNLKEKNELICIVFTYSKNSKDSLKIFHIQTQGTKPVNAIKPLIYELKPDYYITFNEGWSWEITKDEMAKYSLVDLKKMKQRKEVLACYGTTKDGTEKFDKLYEIIRLDGRIDFIEYKGANLRSRKLP